VKVMNSYTKCGKYEALIHKAFNLRQQTRGCRMETEVKRGAIGRRLRAFKVLLALCNVVQLYAHSPSFSCHSRFLNRELAIA